MSASATDGKNEIPYRPDIDGLRGFAILLAVCYHAFPGFPQGGYFAVDVFFVISGYLITLLISRRVDAGTFSFREFYTRRIVRLFPALIFTLLLTALLGSAALFPREFLDLWSEIAAASGYYANFHYARGAGYFETLYGTQMLLHVWSLGLEEQFYLVWPVFILCFSKNRRRLMTALAVLMIASFLFGRFESFRDNRIAYYLPFSRAWELAFGGLISYFPMDERKWRSWAEGTKANSLSVLALLLMIVPILAIDPLRPLPSFWNLLPTLGAGLMILGPRSGLKRVLLENAPIRWVGRISYTIYLLHWPVLTLIRLYLPHEPALAWMLAILGAVFAASAAISKWIENPIRFGRRKGRSAILLLAANSLIFLISFSIAESGTIRSWNEKWFTAGTISGLELASQEKYGDERCRPDDIPARIPWSFCAKNSAEPAELLLLGDSHANHLFFGFSESPRLGKWSIQNIGASFPIFGAEFAFKYRAKDSALLYFPEWDETFERFLTREPRARFALLASAWPTFDREGEIYDAIGPVAKTPEEKGLSPRELFIRATDRLVSLLEKRGIQVAISIDTPLMTGSRAAKSCLVSRPFSDLIPALSRPACPFELFAHSSRVDTWAMIERLKKDHPGLKVFDPTAAFCAGEVCRSHDDQGRAYYRDESHLTPIGSALYAKAFEEWASREWPEIISSGSR